MQASRLLNLYYNKIKRYHLGEQIMNTKIGIALLRISIPTLMLVNHGLGKLQRYEKISTKFPDPLGIGSPLSLILVIFAEVFCSLLVALGLGTRFLQSH